jgi:hypothetical protein
MKIFLFPSIYSINKFGSEIIPIKKSEKPLKFEVRLHNFRARGLKENKVAIYTCFNVLKIISYFRLTGGG